MDPHNIQRDLESAHYNFEATFMQLAEDGHIEQVFSEDEILDRIKSYVDTHKKKLLEFLGENGKILVPMNSAEKFADIVIEMLGIDSSRVTKFKVTTYKDGVSMKKLMTQEEKDDLKNKMNLSMGDKVLMLEDLMDTGHTLHMLEDFLSNAMAEVKVLCLLDKNVNESTETRESLGKRLMKIIDIGQEFVVGFGMDYDHRLGANIQGLWKIKSSAIPEVTKILNTFTEKVEDILKRKEK